MPSVRDPFNTSYLSQRIADTYPKEKIKINMVKERATSVCFYLMVKERASRFFRLSPLVKHYLQICPKNFLTLSSCGDTRARTRV
jgi:hypothetical protein